MEVLPGIKTSVSTPTELSAFANSAWLGSVGNFFPLITFLLGFALSKESKFIPDEYLDCFLIFVFLIFLYQATSTCDHFASSTAELFTPNKERKRIVKLNKNLTNKKNRKLYNYYKKKSHART